MKKRPQLSSDYEALLQQHGEMHAQSDEVFAGRSLFPHIRVIRDLIADLKAESLLDYGAGKGLLYRQNTFGPFKNLDLKRYWNLKEIVLYDPGFTPFSALPDRTFDVVICTDVLEHCLQQDIPWILEEIFSYATKGIFLAIACYPAQKHLPNSQNCHSTIQPPSWWHAQIEATAARHPIACIAKFASEKSAVENK